jgi:hypothetical protein
MLGAENGSYLNLNDSHADHLIRMRITWFVYESLDRHSQIELRGIAFVIRRLGSEFSEWAEAGMRSKYDHIKVEVENSSESGVRTYLITLIADEKDFELTDKLSQRKVINSFDSRLGQALRDATKSYLNSAESLLSALAKKPRQTVQQGTTELETSGARLIRLRRLKEPTK